MNFNGNRWAHACLAIAVIAAPAALAQQQSSASDSYQGVSQPPPDDSIVASQDAAAETTPPQAKPKPSPAVPVGNSSSSAASTSEHRANASGPIRNDSSYDNTDFGIVTVPVSQAHQAAPVPVEGAVLHTREAQDPDADIVTNVGSRNELPAGTEIRVRIAESLSTTQTTAGAPFSGRVMLNVLHSGSVIIPAGSTLRGRVVQVSQGHHLGSPATLRLRPDVVILPDGTAYHLEAEVVDSEAKGTRTGSEGEIQPSSHVVKNSVKYGVGVGTGALVGGELGGPPGLLVGSIVGAGVVTANILLQHPQAAVVPAGSEIIFGLTEPLALVPTRN